MGGFYLNRLPWLLRTLYPQGIWRIPKKEKVVYLTFDDGPHPTITPFVLDLLKRYQARGTFFCIGNNVALFAETYQAVLDAGHRVGNHTFDHLNGWKTNAEDYVANIIKAGSYIRSNLFRPPYGRISHRQAIQIQQRCEGMQLVYWDLLSADFDTDLQASDCVDIVLKGVRPGSVIVFHDSQKAFPRLETALPSILEELSQRGYVFHALP